MDSQRQLSGSQPLSSGGGEVSVSKSKAEGSGWGVGGGDESECVRSLVIQRQLSTEQQLQLGTEQPTGSSGDKDESKSVLSLASLCQFSATQPNVSRAEGEMGSQQGGEAGSSAAVVPSEDLETVIVAETPYRAHASIPDTSADLEVPRLPVKASGGASHRLEAIYKTASANAISASPKKKKKKSTAAVNAKTLSP
uniref:Uncharacterized protein n=1 Tax=Mantoniella antarctica TaxID=81844 RepID=A0A7S0ST14_9CHLO